MGIKITTSVKGIPEVKQMLESIPRFSRGLFTRVVGEYLLGDKGEAFHTENSHGLRHYALWKRVTRKSVYGSSFFSAKQQRAFFAKMKSGEINVPYIRTGNQGKAWRMTGTSTGVRLSNSDPSTKFTRGQTRLHQKMGWQTTMQTVQSNIKGALRAGKAAVVAALRGGKRK